jgi:hypothetical protein
MKNEWTFTSDSRSYMLYKKGRMMGGAETLGTKTHTSDGRRRSWQAIRADRKMYAEMGRRECEARNRAESAVPEELT